MLMEGNFVVSAPIEKVWSNLLNPETLAACIPGCEKMEAIDDNTYNSIVKAKVGPISVKLRFTTNLTEINRPRYLKAVGQGEVLNKMGTFTQETTITLEEIKDGTEVLYRSNVNITGRIATFGDKVMKAKSKEMERHFTQALRQKLQQA